MATEAQADQDLFDTELDRAEDDGCSRTWILSDLHIDIDGGPEVAAMVEILRRAATFGRDARVLILGDLFEFYTAPGQLAHGVWKTVGDELIATVRAGVSVTVLRGNRDFLIDARFARRVGCRVGLGGLVLELDGRRVLAIHGDELCLRDFDYQRMKPKIRAFFPMRFLSYSLPTPVALYFGRRLRRQAKRRQARMAAGELPSLPAAADDPIRFEPIEEAVSAAFERSGAETLVFGHIHAASDSEFEGRRVVVLPAFEEDGVHLYSGPGEPLHHVDRTGRPVEGIPARTFPPFAGE